MPPNKKIPIPPGDKSGSRKKSTTPRSKKGSVAELRVLELEKELKITRQSLQETIEELALHNDELRTTNEELIMRTQELSLSQDLINSVNTTLQEQIAKLNQANNDLDNQLSSTNIGTLFLDSQLRIRRFTPTLTRIMHLMPGDVGRPLHDFSNQLIPDSLVKDTMHVLSTGKTLEQEISLLEGVQHLLRIIPYRNYAGVSDGLVLTFVDITQVKETEIALQKSENRQAALLNAIPDLICRIGANGALQDFKSRMKTVRKIHTGQIMSDWGTWSDLAADLSREILKQSHEAAQIALSTGEIQVLEYQIKLNNKTFYRESRIAPGIDGEYFLIIRDITGRKRSEMQIQESLQEKEVLLQEIHHRVKNNLQIISSMLNLQSGFILDEKYRQMFRESQDRVNSIALIHEKLYQSSDLTRIDFGQYVENLVSHLIQSYEISVALKVEVYGISLEMSQAILCGLIVNELVTNSLKYAFPPPEQTNCRIKITLTPQKNDTYVLLVADNGVGFPDILDISTLETLGLQIVGALSGQLKGRLEWNLDEGVTAKITFNPHHESGV
ncbi:MAG: PAS domain-containing protein [SAR324 cluster bacterium]|nr:PAS domain-containing protein [SAR324 cluster bacterium]